MKSTRSLEDFRAVWIHLASIGHCDAVDGAEYRRLQIEWVREGRPVPMCRWIRAKANKAPVHWSGNN